MMAGGQGSARFGGRVRAADGRMGVACRGGVVAVATATLIYACRDRRSVIRRMVPLTNYESRVHVHGARGGSFLRRRASRQATGWSGQGGWPGLVRPGRAWSCPQGSWGEVA